MLKRFFDIFLTAGFIVLLFWAILLFWILAAIATKSNGLFQQVRIGRNGKFFTIYKFRTMHPVTGRIDRFSNFMRQSKLDELPQLINVLIGDMSIVGPRPDIPGYYDKLEGEDRKILELRPGITSPASLKYRNEEILLATQKNPLEYNDTVIFPDKVRMNLDYYYHRSFWGDISIIWQTVFGK